MHVTASTTPVPVETYPFPTILENHNTLRVIQGLTLISVIVLATLATLGLSPLLSCGLSVIGMAGIALLLSLSISLLSLKETFSLIRSFQTSSKHSQHLYQTVNIEISTLLKIQALYHHFLKVLEKETLALTSFREKFSAFSRHQKKLTGFLPTLLQNIQELSETLKELFYSSEIREKKQLERSLNKSIFCALTSAKKLSNIAIPQPEALAIANETLTDLLSRIEESIKTSEDPTKEPLTQEKKDTTAILTQIQERILSIQKELKNLELSVQEATLTEAPPSEES